MRIIIDMQGAQAESRFRGIGRYTLSFAQGVVRNRSEHEVILALSGLFPDTIEPIRAAFEGLLPQEAIRVWHAPGPVAEGSPGNDTRREVAELIREAFLASLRPDVIHISSLFEGYVDDAVTSIGRFDTHTAVSVTLYDLIPLLNPDHYFKANPRYAQYYQRKVGYLKQAASLLAISEFTRQEGLVNLGVAESQVVNVSTAIEPRFQPLAINDITAGQLRAKFNITRPFVLYTGGIDPRKNIEGLIRAYARLPTELRNSHQLAIVCSIQSSDHERLNQFARKQGLEEGEVIFTGFVPEEDLVALYNLCALFVFPSWHEGFGLPALEAMRCGAPVIAANTSSLPEVVGLPEALFDPYSDAAIAEIMQHSLTDTAFRNRLLEHGKKQAAKFSWDETARRAIHAMEKTVAERQNKPAAFEPPPHPKMAFVSPLPPEHCGIANYSAELLPALARYYDIDLIVAQGEVTDPWVKANCPVRSVDWFIRNADGYQRVLYHFGNSAFHQHMFGLLRDIPGVVVLHDFYLSGVCHYMEATGYAPGNFTQELFRSHGYAGLLERHNSRDVADVIWRYPCNLGVIQHSLGVIAHSANTLKLAKQWYGLGGDGWYIIPLLRDPVRKRERIQARATLGMQEEDFIVCSFGMLGPTKLNHRLLQAWNDSKLSQSGRCHLVFVGENHPGDYGHNLKPLFGKSRNIQITGWADENQYFQYMAAADVGVQLRTLSRGETSAAALDCLNYGLATIVNANGSMADLDSEAVWMLPNEFEEADLVTALETLWQEPDRRQRMGENARQIICARHNPSCCAEQYQMAIEQCYAIENTPVHTLSKAITSVPGHMPKQTELIALASAISVSFPPVNGQRQLMVDISELVQRDARTGIQRVVRNVLREWLLNSPEGWRIEPVYATVEQPYRYARQFTARFLGLPSEILADEPIDYAQGDIFFGLDLQPRVQAAHAGFYQQLRRQGVQVKFMVYDLLCILQPKHFGPGASEGFTNWLKVVAESDGAVCISKTVADELAQWMHGKAWSRLRPFAIEWNHLGADIQDSPTSRSLPDNAPQILSSLKQRPSFLMVGTLEPRKGHLQVLDAFEQLWQGGSAVNLVIVGKVGWMVEALVERLRGHSEVNKRLFWLEGISDEYLEKIYAASTCLIAASYGEGFGLPLIEAARHKLPIIARDIPVFREVAQNHAHYFSGDQANELAEAIQNWLKLRALDLIPDVSGLAWLSWEESAEALKKQLTAAAGDPGP